MKKIGLLCIFLLFLVGCEPADDEYAEIEERAEADVDNLSEQIAALREQIEQLEQKMDEKEEVTVTTVTVVEEEPQVIVTLGNLSPDLLATNDVPPAPVAIEQQEEELTEQIQAILEKADTIVESYAFLYALPPSDISGSWVHIKGTKMKIDLKETSVYGGENYIDTIYVDFTAKTAAGYCEDSRIGACANRSKKTDLVFEEYNLKTPYQWLKEIPVARKIADQLIWDREADVLEHIDNETTYKYWIDKFSGIPVKIHIKELGKDKVIYEFRHLSINHLKDSDVVNE